MQFQTQVSGIPCICNVVDYISVPAWKGSAYTCPSSDDYYGYTEFDFELLDRKGYKANWLEKKLKPEDKDRLLEELQLELLGERYGYL